jgi:hypothetical protein
MNTQDVVKSAAEASPPVVYAALHIFGVSLPDWVALATLAYIILQAGHLLWRWHRQAKRNGSSD